MQAPLLIGAAGAMALTLFALFAQHRRDHRRDPDRVGIISWPLVQIVSLLAAIMLTALAIVLA